MVDVMWWERETRGRPSRCGEGNKTHEKSGKKKEKKGKKKKRNSTQHTAHITEHRTSYSTDTAISYAAYMPITSPEAADTVSPTDIVTSEDPISPPRHPGTGHISPYRKGCGTSAEE